jgi:hypothetical protein
MTSSLLPTDPAAPVNPFDRVRAAMRFGQAAPAAGAARAERVQRRNQARAERAHRLFVARFGSCPAGRAATTLHHGGWGA